MRDRGDSLEIAVLYNPDRPWQSSIGDAINVFEAAAWLHPVPLSEPGRLSSAVQSADAVLLLDPFAVQDLPETMSTITCPVIVNFQPLMWHSYDAIARTFFERRGVPVLPSDSKETLQHSLQALVSRIRLGREKILLFVGERGRNQNMESARHLPQRLGVQVEMREVQELKDRAAVVPLSDATDVLLCWKRDVFRRIHPNISEKYLLEEARLYLAEKAIAAEVGATALSVEEFAPFLFQDRPMPNITYAILKNEGILTAEEADLGVLSTMVLLRALTGEPNTMANVYLAWRDEYERIKSGDEYTQEMMRLDYQQCLEDGLVAISHFGSAGSLPLNMMQEERYDVIETTPPWPRQAMLYSTPKLGALDLVRLHDDGNTIDVYSGDGQAIRLLERDDFLRLRWMVQINTRAFMVNAIHPHWALAVVPAQQAFDIFCARLLGLQIRRFPLETGITY